MRSCMTTPLVEIALSDYYEVFFSTYSELDGLKLIWSLLVGTTVLAQASINMSWRATAS